MHTKSTNVKIVTHKGYFAAQRLSDYARPFVAVLVAAGAVLLARQLADLPTRVCFSSSSPSYCICVICVMCSEYVRLLPSLCFCLEAAQIYRIEA